MEISEILLSEVLNDVETFRLDSEYHLKEYERISSFIKQNPKRFIKFNDLKLEIDCSAFYAGVEQYYGTGDFPLIRVQNVNGTIDYDSCEKIPRSLLDKSGYETLKTVEKGDIVITKGGSIGFVGYITQDACASRDLIFVKSSILSENQQLFLYIYLSTNFVYKQLIRSSSQCAQPHLTITLVKNLDLLNASEQFQNKISEMVKSAHNKLEQSKLLYKQTEEILEKELGIDFESLTKKKSVEFSIVNSQSSIFSSGRLDAEYYQEKYDNLFSYLKESKTRKLGEIVKITKSIEPGSDCYLDSGIPFYRVSNLSEQGLSTPEIFLDEKTFSDVVRPKKNTILFSKDGSIGIAYKIRQDLDGITSGALLHLTVTDKEILPDYLTLVLNSKIVKMQADHDAGGSIIQHWKPSEIKEVVIPVLVNSVQSAIAEKIMESFRLREESKQLLEDAKLAVEREIEKGAK